MNMVFTFCDVSKLLSFSEEKSIINNADKNTLTIFTVYTLCVVVRLSLGKTYACIIFYYY